MTITIDVGKDFSRFPGGRLREDGKFSGQAFREDHILPALAKDDKISIILDNTAGYGSSFLEEAFGGLIRCNKYNKNDIKNKIQLITDDDYLLTEIHGYISEAKPE